MPGTVALLRCCSSVAVALPLILERGHLGAGPPGRAFSPDAELERWLGRKVKPLWTGMAALPAEPVQFVTPWRGAHARLTQNSPRGWPRMRHY